MLLAFGCSMNQVVGFINPEDLFGAGFHQESGVDNIPINESMARQNFRVSRFKRDVLYYRRNNPLCNTKFVIRISTFSATITYREAHIRISYMRTCIVGFGYIFSHIFIPHVSAQRSK